MMDDTEDIADVIRDRDRLRGEANGLAEVIERLSAERDRYRTVLEWIAADAIAAKPSAIARRALGEDGT